MERECSLESSSRCILGVSNIQTPSWQTLPQRHCANMNSVLLDTKKVVVVVSVSQNTHLKFIVKNALAPEFLQNRCYLAGGFRDL